MRAVVNGREEDLPDGISVADLLARLVARTDAVAVEVNLRVVPRTEHARYRIEEGDRVEIVTFTGGG